MINLLNKIADAGIVLEVVDGNLKVFSNSDSIDGSLIGEIKKKKHEIVEYLVQTGTLNEVDKNYRKIQPTASNDSYPLSPGQYRLWTLSQIEGGTSAYNMPSKIKLNGEYNHLFLEKAINDTIKRHEILRTVFKMDKFGEIRQFILPADAVAFKLAYSDLRDEQKKEDRVDSFMKKDSFLPFNLEKGPLLRAHLFQLEAGKYLFYYNMHHIISDGWSLDVIAKDVFAFYEAYVQNKPVSLSTLEIQYKDYAVWQLNELESSSMKVAKTYWMNKLSGELPVLDLPSNKIRPLSRTYNGFQLRSYFSTIDLKGINTFGQKRGGSLFMTLLSACNVLFHKYTGEKDIIIGTPVAGRNQHNLENQIGFYVNTIPLRNQIQAKDSFDQFYNAAKQNVLTAFEFQTYPFDQLVENLDLKRDLNRSAVFDIVMTLQNTNSNNTFLASEIDIDQIFEIGKSVSKFDVELSFQESNNLLIMDLVFNCDVYEKEVMKQLMNDFKRLLLKLIENPELNINKVDFLAEKDKKDLIELSEGLKIDFYHQSVIELFLEQVQIKPDQVAIEYKETKLTYAELDKQSNQLANYLLSNYQLKPEEVVGIKLNRSEKLVIAILAIFKTGAAYVPLDIGWPNRRLKEILEDVKPNFILDNSVLDQFYKQEFLSSDNPGVNIDVSSLAYIIFTSGSTGKPKGVMIEHCGLTNFVRGFGLQPSRCSMTGNHTFDVSILEIFTALSTGSTLIIPDVEIVMNPDDYANFIFENKVSHCYIHPMHVEQIGEVLSQKKEVFLKRILIGVESIKKDAIRWYLKNGVNVINAYGPTETSIGATYYPVKHLDGIATVNLPIGKPFPNYNTYIFSQDTSLLAPKGVIGEMCIGGIGVSRGYVNRPEKTSEKFVNNPFKPNEKLYRTGDLVRWMADDNLEFIGRKDSQIKLRGYRVELGEIEHHIKRFDASIKQALAQVKMMRDTQVLVVYYSTNIPIDKRALKDYLSNHLPGYMVPNYYMELEALPITQNGKIDRAKLPMVSEVDVLKKEYVPPKSDTEKRLVVIWEDLFGLDMVGIADDFFELGGHSLKAVTMLLKINREFDVNIEITSVYNLRCIADLALLIEQSIWDKLQIDETKVVEKITI